MTSDRNNGMKTTTDNERLTLTDPQERPRYTLAELLAQCDHQAELTEDDIQWLDAPSVGRELL